MELGTGPQQRIIHATLAPGVTLVERVEIAPAAVTGTLRVETEPSRAARARERCQQGQVAAHHRAAAAGRVPDRRRRRQAVTATCFDRAERDGVGHPHDGGAANNASIGWLVVTSPRLVQLREDGKVIGSTDMERVTLPAGEHTIEMVNDPLEYRATRRI